MKGKTHKILGFVLFTIFYFFKLFPAIISNYLVNFLNVLIALLITYLFSGGRVNSKRFWTFGLSADNDFHKRMKRDWLMHSAIIPTLIITLTRNPILVISSFFYTVHVAFDLLNTHSWEGNKKTYIAVFITVILYFLIIYKL